MGDRVNNLAVVSVLALLVLGGWAIAPAGGSEETMCPPVTIDDLFAEDTTTTTTSTTTTSTSSTTSSTTTTIAPTTTATAPTTTTTASTTTTDPQESTTTTVASTTTAPDSSTTPTSTAPETSEATTTTLPPEPPCDTPFLYPLVFPLAGQGVLGSPFGAPRDGGSRQHLGNDIAAPRLQPVVAAADGTVTRIAGDSGISGYRVHVEHDDGWSTLYIHLNNDTAGSDDASGVGIRPDLREGDRVDAGEVIGWNGDSGNAESTEPHLHFELRDPSGNSVDPRPSLEAADQVYPDFSGPFADLESDDPTHPLHLLLTRGAPVWCDDAARACPEDPITVETLGTWVEAVVGPVDVSCSEDCDRLTELDLVRTLVTSRTGVDASSLSALEVFTELEGARMCRELPDDAGDLTRAEAARALVTWLGWVEQPHCPTSSLNR